MDFVENLKGGVKDLRIAYSPALRHAIVDEEVARLMDAAAHRFEDLGAHIEQIDPFEEDPREIFRMHWWVGAATTLGDLSDEAKAHLDPGLAEIIEEGQRIPLVDYQKAVRARETFGSGLQKFLTEYDLLITPVVAVPAFEAGRNAPDGWSGHGDLHHWLGWAAMSYPFNLSQQPAASVPCGFTSTGLPVGLQIVAAKYRDDLVLRAAAAYEAVHPVWKRRAGGSANIGE